MKKLILIKICIVALFQITIVNASKYETYIGNNGETVIVFNENIEENLGSVELSYKQAEKIIFRIEKKTSFCDSAFYSFQLSGYDSTWTIPTKSCEILYNNLAGGEYFLHLKTGCDSSSLTICNTKWHIKIQKRFWETSWFRMALLTIIIVIFSSLRRWIKNNRKKKL